MFILGATTCFGVSLSLTYLIDCYHGIAGKTLATVLIIRNTMCFAISYG